MRLHLIYRAELQIWSILLLKKKIKHRNKLIKKRYLGLNPWSPPMLSALLSPKEKCFAYFSNVVPLMIPRGWSSEYHVCLIIMMKQSAKQHLINKLPQQAMDVTLSTRGCYRVDFLFKFLHEISFLPELFTLRMPTESLSPGVCVFASMNIIFTV